MSSISAFSGAPSCFAFALNAELPSTNPSSSHVLLASFCLPGLADTCKRQKTTAENSARRSFDSRFFYAVFSSFSVATVVFEKEWSNHWERVRFPLPLRLQLQNSSLVDRSRLVVAVMWSRCEILARP